LESYVPRVDFIVKRSLKVLALAFGLFGTFVFILDGLYIGLFASPEVLVNYPWGTELGWAYESKYNYMAKGLVIGGICWLPYFGIVGNRSNVT